MRPLDAGGTRHRLRALLAMGHSANRCAQAIGADPQTMQKVIRAQQPTVSPELAQSVAALYDAWWDKRAPERTPSERRASLEATRRAVRNDWCCPMGLDDDQLDVPGYAPDEGWDYARGSGTAPDITPGLAAVRMPGHADLGRGLRSENLRPRQQAEMEAG